MNVSRDQRSTSSRSARRLATQAFWWQSANCDWLITTHGPENKPTRQLSVIYIQVLSEENNNVDSHQNAVPKSRSRAIPQRNPNTHIHVYAAHSEKHQCLEIVLGPRLVQLAHVSRLLATFFQCPRCERRGVAFPTHDYNVDAIKQNTMFS